MSPRARGRTRALWHLYVDESGDFDDPQAHAIVAGVLIPSEQVPRGVALRRALEAQVAGFPWPWHTTWINCHMWVAMALVHAAADRTAADRIGSQVLRAASDAVDCIREQAPAVVDAVRAVIRAGGQPHEHRRLLDEWWGLVRARRGDCVAPIEDCGQSAIVALQRLLESLAAFPGAEEAGPVAAFAAAELELGDAVEQHGALAVGDRYLNLLAVLVQRVAAAVALRGGGHELHLHVLERHVRYPRLGVTRPLKAAAVNTVTSAIRSSLPAGLVVAVDEVVAFSGSLSPWFVLADFVANRMRRGLEHAQATLVEVEQQCSKRCGLELRRFSRRSPLAASGEAYRLVTTGAPDESTAKAMLPWTPVRRRWACEQAWEWAVMR